MCQILVFGIIKKHCVFKDWMLNSLHNIVFCSNKLPEDYMQTHAKDGTGKAI